MPHILLGNPPADVAQKLHEQTGDELLSFFKTLPWDGFLVSFLDEPSNDVLKHLLTRLIAAMPDEGLGQAVLPLGETDKTELVAELKAVYLLRCSGEANVSTIVSDIERAWSAREDDKAGREAVAQAIDIVFIKDHAHKECLPIAKTLDALGIKCEEIPTASGRPSKFYVGSKRGATASKQLQAFWEAFVAEDTAEGFMGRAYDEDTDERRERFRSIWVQEALQALDSQDAKNLATFLSYEGQAVSPSAASCRRFLERILVDDLSDGPVAEASRLILKVPHPPKKRIPEEKEKPKSSRRVKETAVKEKRPTGKARRTPRKVLVDTDSESESSSDHTFRSDEPPDEEFVFKSRDRKHPKFPGLPRKMIQVLEQGGEQFEELFEPLRVDITTPKDLYTLLKYFNDGQRVTRELCRASGLTVDPNMCVEKLEVGRIFRIRPDHRLADTLSFEPTTRRAPRILHRWMSHGSIIPWLHALCARAGQVEKDNADGYLAREIMSAGLTLASLLNEFHPAHLLYSSAVERLVRRLWVIEKALSMERQDRGAYTIKMLGFMGIGQGAVTDPEELH